MVTSNESSSEFIPLADAAKELGVTHNYLRLLIFKKKLRAVKLGRNWVTTRIWLDECFNGIRRNNTPINDNVTPSKEVRVYDLSFSTKLILILLSISFLSSAYQIIPIEAVKKMAQGLSLGMPSTSSGSNDLFSTSSNNKLLVPEPVARPSAAIPAIGLGIEGLQYAKSLLARTKSSFTSARSQISVRTHNVTKARTDRDLIPRALTNLTSYDLINYLGSTAAGTASALVFLLPLPPPFLLLRAF